jgi:1-pyrroline-5-carboxylate dehydrogenase
MNLPRNEPVLGYTPGSPERAELKRALEATASERLEIPLLVGGQSVRTQEREQVRMPHHHAHVLADLHHAGPREVDAAIQAALRAKESWATTPFEKRAAVFLRAAELLATRHRARLNAATMLGQSKTVVQAEIDSACESIDFLRFNVAFAEAIQAEQPLSVPGIRNSLDYRPLDGFVFAVAPFNFTAIGLNLPTAPALLGNTVVFKPASTAALSAWRNLELLREAGLPDGVINFVPGDGPTVGNAVLASPHLGGLHFTGSPAVFQSLWQGISAHLPRYHQYPRIVGETGGKGFIFAHASARDQLEALAVAILRGGFEYQGQKCSAASRVYIPDSLWPRLRSRLLEQMADLHMGDVADFRTFLGAVIDARAFRKIQGYLGLARSSAQVLAGGDTNDAEGYFVQPTLVQVSDPRHRLLVEEIFGPVVTVFVYPEADFESTLAACDQASPYALTGSIFASDPGALAQASARLRHAAGNFYINDKPTGAVVGQQPFGGSRGSGTNDKAGSALNLTRWVSARTVKEALAPPTELGYPSMREP